MFGVSREIKTILGKVQTNLEHLGLKLSKPIVNAENRDDIKVDIPFAFDSHCASLRFHMIGKWITMIIFESQTYWGAESGVTPENMEERLNRLLMTYYKRNTIWGTEVKEIMKILPLDEGDPEKYLEKLRVHLMYAPGGPGSIEAEEDFEERRIGNN